MNDSQSRGTTQSASVLASHNSRAGGALPMAARAPACLAAPTWPALIMTGRTPGKRAAMAAVWSWQLSSTTTTCTCTPAVWRLGQVRARRGDARQACGDGLLLVRGGDDDRQIGGSTSRLLPVPCHRQLPEPGEVAFGMMLAHIQLKVSHPPRMIFVEGQRRRPQRVADLAQGPLGRISHHSPHPQAQFLPGRSVGFSRVDQRRRVGLARPRMRAGRHRPAPRAARKAHRSARPTSQPDVACRPAAPPCQHAATPMPPQANPGLARYQPGAPTGAAGVPSSRMAALVTVRRPRATQPSAGSKLTDGVPQRHPEKLTVRASVGSDQGGVKLPGQRAPRLDTMQNDLPAALACLQPVRCRLRREHPPCPGRDRLTGLRQDRQRIAVCLQYPADRQALPASGGQHRPACCGISAPRLRQQTAELLGQPQRRGCVLSCLPRGLHQRVRPAGQRGRSGRSRQRCSPSCGYLLADRESWRHGLTPGRYRGLNCVREQAAAPAKVAQLGQRRSALP